MSQLIVGVDTTTGDVGTSPDLGLSWGYETAASGETLYGIDISKDGSKITACAFGGHIWTKSGGLWTSRDIARNWFRNKMSANGVIQVAIVYGGYVYVSTDSGATWTPCLCASPPGVAGVADWHGVDISADGTKIVVCAYTGGGLWRSDDSGATWASLGTPCGPNPADVAISNDGVYITICGAGPGQCYSSQDSGATFGIFSTIADAWLGVKMSDSGQYQTAIGYSAPNIAWGVFSINYGVTSFAVTFDTGPLGTPYDVTMNDDGTIQFCGFYGGPVYKSVDYGANFIKQVLDANVFGAIAISEPLLLHEITQAIFI